MRALASNSTVLTPGTDKQHLLISHGYFLHPKHKTGMKINSEEKAPN